MQLVGKVGSMPGTTGFTMAVFKAEDVPVGTKLYIPEENQALIALKKYQDAISLCLSEGGTFSDDVEDTPWWAAIIEAQQTGASVITKLERKE